MNCVDARVECHRTRQSRLHRPRVSRYVAYLHSWTIGLLKPKSSNNDYTSLDALAERLARLEESTSGENQITSHHLASPVPVSPHARPQGAVGNSANAYPDPTCQKKRKKQYATHFSRETSPGDPPERKQKRSQAIGHSHGEAHSPGSTRHASEAREYIEHELQCNLALSKDRRTALESAQKFVSQLSNPSLHWEETGVAGDLDVEETTPPTLTPELLYMMLPGPDKKTNSQGTISWPDHISDALLERMGLAIIEGSECEQVLQHYRVSVWVKAISCISKVAPLTSSERLRDHFRTLKKQYEAAAMEELNQIPLTAAPSLLLLQSLLSGVRLMQYLGNMSRCWMFTALASRIIVSLNYHNITDPTPRNEVEENIHACVYKCYYFDKTLSLLLLRPPSLPELKVEASQLIHLDPDLPTAAMITGIVEFSDLKNILVNILLDTKELGDLEKANILSDLVARAHTIHSNLEMFRRHQELEFPNSWAILRREWLSMDFNYYSVLTTIIRARSSVLKSRLVCENCLYAAREALNTLRALQEAFSSPANSVDSYPYFLTWTMLLFPLSPFFVLFCNVIATSNERDFTMIKNITDDLHQFAQANASIGKLYRLFSKFLDLCAPLIKSSQEHAHSDQPLYPFTHHHHPAAVEGRTEAQVGLYTNMFGRGVDEPVPTPSSQITHKINTGAPQPVEGWNDNLVWELFDNQPSLRWAESELWDVMTQLDSA